MSHNAPTPQINVSKIVVGGGIAGAIFTVGSMVIFVLGIPLLRYVFPAAIVLGCAVALFLHFVRHETPGTSCLFSATQKEAKIPPARDQKGNASQRFLIEGRGVSVIYSEAQQRSA